MEWLLGIIGILFSGAGVSLLLEWWRNKKEVDARFSDAVKNLRSKEDLNVVLNGIRVLHEIAVKHKKYRKEVHKQFCTYLRKKSAELYKGVDFEKTPDECPVIIQELIDHLFKHYNNKDCIYKDFESDLSYSTLKNCNFIKVEVNKTNFDNCILERCNFNESILNDCKFKTLNDCKFNIVTFNNCSFEEGLLNNCKFDNVIINCWFCREELNNCYFNEVKLNDCGFYEGRLNNCIFRKGRLFCRFNAATLNYCGFLGGTTLSSCWFDERGTLNNCLFGGGTLYNCWFYGKKLSNCSFYYATLTKCNFGENKDNCIVLDKCNFDKAKLVDCKIEYAKLIDTQIPDNIQQVSIYPKTLEKYKKTLKISRKLTEEKLKAYLTRVATILFNLAILHKSIKEYPMAFNEYEEALKGGNAKGKAGMYLTRVATVLNNLAILHKTTKEYPMALKEYEEALEIRRKLAEENPKAKIYLDDVANTLHNLAILHKSTNEYLKALEEYKEALEIFRNRAEEYPKAYLLSHVATVLFNLAILHEATNEYPKALKEYEEALEIFRRLAEENPKAYLANVAMVLNNLEIVLKKCGKNYFEQNHYDEAEKYYLRCLEIREELVKEKSDTFPFLIQNYGSISWCYLFTKKYEQSEQSACKALELDSTALWVKANLAHSLLFQNRLSEAEAIYKELSKTVYQNDETYIQALLNDFDELEKAGAIPKKYKTDVKKIREMLRN